MKINYKILCSAAALTIAANFFVARAQTTADDMQALIQQQLQAIGGAPIGLGQTASTTAAVQNLTAKTQFFQHILEEMQGGNFAQILQELKRARASGAMTGAEIDQLIPQIQKLQTLQQLEQQSRLGGNGINQPLNLVPPSANCPGAKTLKDVLSLTENDYRILVTWKAKSLVPPLFPGKALPTTGSEISASFEILRNGKIINPGGQAAGGKLLGSPIIYWYVNDELIRGSQGKQTVTLTLPTTIVAPDTLSLQVQIPQYREYPLCEQEGEKFLFQPINVPLAAPEAVIEAPYASGNIFGSTAELKAVPYFFNSINASKLSYEWSVNGETAPGAEDPTRLKASINAGAPIGSAVNVGLSIQDPKRPALLPGSANINLNYYVR